MKTNLNMSMHILYVRLFVSVCESERVKSTVQTEKDRERQRKENHEEKKKKTLPSVPFGFVTNCIPGSDPEPRIGKYSVTQHFKSGRTRVLIGLAVNGVLGSFFVLPTTLTSRDIYIHLRASLQLF